MIIGVISLWKSNPINGLHIVFHGLHTPRRWSAHRFLRFAHPLGDGLHTPSKMVCTFLFCFIAHCSVKVFCALYLRYLRYLKNSKNLWYCSVSGASMWITGSPGPLSVIPDTKNPLSDQSPNRTSSTMCKIKAANPTIVMPHKARYL